MATFLLDTNLLLRLSDGASPDQALADQAIKRVNLVATHVVKGKKVHDARLVTVMLAHGVTHLLTFNTSDFINYPGITLVHPSDV